MIKECTSLPFNTYDQHFQCLTKSVNPQFQKPSGEIVDQAYVFKNAHLTFPKFASNQYIENTERKAGDMNKRSVM